MNALRTTTFTLALLTSLSACAQNPTSTAPAAQPVAQSAAAATSASAGADLTATDMKILADKIKADKRLVVAANMQLTEAEAKGFWPLYDDYQKQLQNINAHMVKGIADYAEASTKGPLTDAKAKTLLDDMLKVESSELELKRSFVPKLSKVLPPVKVTRYLQIESKIRAIIKHELASEIPLVE
ncbi:MAG TPA: hypothetical protein VM553_12535 [Dongiaceae bacterium]|nr:hypothetical protein [Dongiaceae bacterium]